VEKAQTAGRAPRLFVNEADRSDLDAWLRRHGLDRKRLALLQPGNKRTLKRGRAGQLGDEKAWPSERWEALIRHVLARDPQIHVVLCGVPAERSVLRAIADAADSSRVLEASGELPLRRLLALLERAVGMISVDTGPAHAAAAMGCPLIVLYGAHSPAQWLPRSPSGSPVIGLGGPPQRHRVSEIALEEVLAAWDRLPLRLSA
jgi:heptosyltransferase-2/heptosyltransferase-3